MYQTILAKRVSTNKYNSSETAEIRLRTIERREIIVFNGNLTLEEYTDLIKPHFILLELYVGGRTPYISKVIAPDTMTPFSNAV